MNIQQFHYILAVEKYKHFETAAEKCFVTQSTLSTMISKFESEIGIQIFDRKTKPVSITKEGEKIIQQLKIITYDIDQLIELTKTMKGEVSGALKVGCIPTIAPYLLPLFLQEFSANHPDLIIEMKEITTNEIVRLLKTRELDIGIVSTPIGESELTEYPLYQEPFVLFNMAKKQRTDLHIKDITWDNFWLLKEGHCMSDQVIDICNFPDSDFQSHTNLLLKAGSIDSLIRFVKAYQGKTFLPYLATLDLPKEEQQFLTFFNNPQPKRTVGLLVHKHFAQITILKQFQQDILLKVQEIPALKLISKD